MALFIDTGVLYALFDVKDDHHLDSVSVLMHALEGRFGRPYTTDYVVLEVTTLLKVRAGARVASALVNLLKRGGVSVVVIDDESYGRALTLFEKKVERLSLCDAATLVIMDEMAIRTLATYDQRSFSNLVKEIVGSGYFRSLNEEDKKRAMELSKTANG